MMKQRIHLSYCLKLRGHLYRKRQQRQSAIKTVSAVCHLVIKMRH